MTDYEFFEEVDNIQVKSLEMVKRLAINAINDCLEQDMSDSIKVKTIKSIIGKIKDFVKGE